ncbi:hypothetical protein GGQ80_001627 [Sphingomonas jinjuensis]|uniref:Uncharacterized protein n=1 Tax=Sphingomonas jinjuensis TaxID=535907 RepID=A0A840FAR4_9SPHN|nr:hypothetical protein [Sphingomonas jinjuensis]MBB4153721.1 hypothetical protein [Sphingomonas jinjuensis]
MGAGCCGTDHDRDVGQPERITVSRRGAIGIVSGGAAVALASPVLAAEAKTAPVNLAKVAKASGKYVSGDTSYAALNNGAEPANSADAERCAYGTWPKTDG